MIRYTKHIFVCVNERPETHPRGSCARCGGMDICLRFVQLIGEHGLKGQVRANKSGCLDACELGPTVVIYPDNIWYTDVSLEDVDEIFETSVLGNEPVQRLAAGREHWERLKRIRLIGSLES